MGDRANICIQYEKGERIYFYGHWSGEDYAQALQRALAKHWRWDDEAYLSRIIWDEFCPTDMRGEETSFGISPFICDNEHPILVVIPSRRVVLREAYVTSYRNLPAKEWTFDEYVALPLDRMNQLIEESVG